MKRPACLVYGPMAHHLDHLVPIADLLGIPLIVTEEDLFSQLKKYYPFVDAHHYPYDILPDKFVQTFDIAFTCLPRLTFEEIFFFAQNFNQKKVHTIWVPHGNSDKGHHSYFMEGLNREEVLLVYGKKMIDFLIQKKAYAQLKATVQMGNLRLSHYLKHKMHYDSLTHAEVVRKLTPSPRTILYAPTWHDEEDNGTFFDAAPHLIENLPPSTSLIIKLHPNLLQQEEIKLDLLMEKHEHTNNLLFLRTFPPIYPLLNAVDIYLGDMSSIGYDFLALNKPLFFLNKHKRDVRIDPSLYLMRCGQTIRSEEYPAIYSLIEEALPEDTKMFSQVRKEVYTYTFGKPRRDEELKKEITETFALFPENDLPQL